MELLFPLMYLGARGHMFQCTLQFKSWYELLIWEDDEIVKKRISRSPKRLLADDDCFRSEEENIALRVGPGDLQL